MDILHFKDLGSKQIETISIQSSWVFHMLRFICKRMQYTVITWSELETIIVFYSTNQM